VIQIVHKIHGVNLIISDDIPKGSFLNDVQFLGGGGSDYVVIFLTYGGLKIWFFV